MIIRSKAPLRISFCGGGTDVSPYVEEFGGVVLSCTMNKYTYASLSPNDHKEYRIQSLDFDTIVRYGPDEVLRVDEELSLVKAVIQEMKAPSGLDLFLHSDAPPGSGLGASSTVAVTVVGLMNEHLQRCLTSYQIAELAYRIERELLKIKGGRQDQYAACFGGFNLIEFHKDSTVVNPLRINPSTLNELEYHLMLCYTGKTRRSSGLIDYQIERYVQKEVEAMDAMREMKDVVRSMKDALLRDRLYDFGELLEYSATLKKRMNPRVTTEAIEELCEVGKKHGAIAGKLLGAGGGGYLLFFVRFNCRHKVAEALQQAGGQVVDFAFELNGLQTWRTNNLGYEFAICNA